MPAPPHPPGTYRAPGGQFDNELVTRGTKKSKEDFQALLGPDKAKLIVVYCGFVACKRSHNGAAWARKLGYTNVKRHPGGIFAWKGAGYSTEGAP